MCAYFAYVKYPDSYAASLSKRVNMTECQITEMTAVSAKSHSQGRLMYRWSTGADMGRLNCHLKKKCYLYENLVHMAYGPDRRVTHYKACNVEEQSEIRDYYGVLTDITQLDFLGNHQVVVFKCDWYEGKSIQKDKFNYTSINTSKPWKTNEPFVLASQAQQVFYVDDIKLGKDWKVVIEAKAISSWNWHRTDIPPATVEEDEGVPLLVDHDDKEEEDYTLEEYDEASEGHTCDDDEDDWDIW
ncbi:basic helix-loop-helix (bHLH) DNA-bindingsuperfamily protein [Striga asiatica]|uniref:Basic helix-loop-helix (BHLH) DNA-bindingsuperfamily protein n=1 Tax=Striga asiatica TaxID=4170 RepID=A0A5A7QZ49_STRAF|nr:basic helix-loop-helix (bHLH) DNA-bindingsuperfamily protein [Striga asiatica]